MKGTQERTAIRVGVLASLLIGLLLLIILRPARSLPVPRPHGQDTSMQAPAGRIEQALPRSSDPAEVPSSNPPSEASTDSGVPIVVRDLGSGVEVDEIELVVRVRMADPPPERTFERTVMASGGVIAALGGTWAGVAAVVSEGWACPEQSVQEVLEARTLWVYRMVEIEGTVHGSAGAQQLDPESVTLRGAFGGAPGSPPTAQRDQSPWSMRWLARHGFAVKLDLGRPNAEGRFRVRIPGFLGMAITADAEGWCPAWGYVQTGVELVEQQMDLVLKPAVTITGMVAAEDGTPVANAEVHLYVTRRAPFGELRSEQAILFQPSGGVVAIGSERRNLSALTLHRIFVTGPDGRYSGSLKMEGELLSVAYVEGFAMSDSAWGLTRADRSGVDMTVTRLSSARTARFVFAGNVAKRVSFVISDLSLEIPQPARAYQTDDSGAINAQWLVPGRWYSLIPTGEGLDDEWRRARYFRWENQEALDLAALPSKRP